MKKKLSIWTKNFTYINKFFVPLQQFIKIAFCYKFLSLKTSTLSEYIQEINNKQSLKGGFACLYVWVVEDLSGG